MARRLPASTSSWTRCAPSTSNAQDSTSRVTSRPRPRPRRPGRTNPVVVGSAAMGLMTWRDLDVTVVCQSLNRRQVLGVAAELAGHQDVKALQYRNDTGRWNQEPEKYPDGLYLGLCCHPPELPEWKLDLWFVDDPARQPDLGHLRTLPERLTDNTRLAILRIKTLWSARPQYGT